MGCRGGGYIQKVCVVRNLINCRSYLQFGFTLTALQFTDTSASESFDQTYESSSCTFDDEDSSFQSSLETQPVSSLRHKMTPLKLPPAKLDLSSPESSDELSSKVNEEVSGKFRSERRFSKFASPKKRRLLNKFFFFRKNPSCTHRTGHEEI